VHIIIVPIVCRVVYDVLLFFSEPKLQTPNHFLLSVMLNAPLPLWTPTVHVRGKNYRYRIPLVLRGKMAQCSDTRLRFGRSRFEPWEGLLCCVHGKTLTVPLVTQKQMVPVNCWGNQCWGITSAGLETSRGSGNAPSRFVPQLPE